LNKVCYSLTVFLLLHNRVIIFLCGTKHYFPQQSLRSWGIKSDYWVAGW